MQEEKPFDIAKPRTSKGEARVRERVAMDAMRTLIEIGDEETFRDVLSRVYGIKPGEPRYEAALKAWRLARTSK
jgi:hypothetical protein